MRQQTETGSKEQDKHVHWLGQGEQILHVDNSRVKTRVVSKKLETQRRHDSRRLQRKTSSSTVVNPVVILGAFEVDQFEEEAVVSHYIEHAVQR